MVKKYNKQRIVRRDSYLCKWKSKYSWIFKKLLKKIQKKCWQFYLLMIIYSQVKNYRYSNKYFIGTFTESVSGWKHTMQIIEENGLNGKKSEF